jgi:deoxyribose-phosphate aldolase
MINQYIDHTLLKPDATLSMINKLCQEAHENNFAAVCVNAYYVKAAAQQLKDSKVNVCTVVGFPLGASPSSTKAQEAQVAISEGAVEIDMVVNIGALKDGDTDFVTSDIKAVKEVCSKGNALLKVIIETSLLNEEEKIKACKCVTEAKADFIKTSTGFAGGGATLEDVTLMKNNISETIRIKASGGVRDLETAKKMIEAGASRIGTSSGIAICKGDQATTDY